MTTADGRPVYKQAKTTSGGGHNWLYFEADPSAKETGWWRVDGKFGCRDKPKWEMSSTPIPSGDHECGKQSMVARDALRVRSFARRPQDIDSAHVLSPPTSMHSWKLARDSGTADEHWDVVPWPGVTVRCSEGGGTGLDNTAPSSNGLPTHDYRVTAVIGMFGLCPEGTEGDDDQGAQGCQQFGDSERASMIEVLSDVLMIDEADISLGQLVTERAKQQATTRRFADIGTNEFGINGDGVQRRLLPRHRQLGELGELDYNLLGGDSGSNGWGGAPATDSHR